MSRTDTHVGSFARSLASAYQRLGAGNRRVLLAVSGGADSSALLAATLQIASRVPLHPEVASLDHGLRPEGASEVARVRALSERWGVPFHTRQLGLPAGPGAEERARRARYEALEAIRREADLDLIATAHTANDQAETLLMRIARGAALRGAAAVRPVRGRVIRPLLQVTREEVLAYLRERGIAWSEDPMNADESLLRTRIRHRALPALVDAAGAHVIGAFARFAGLAAEDETFLHTLAESALSRIRLDAETLDRVGLLSLPPPLRRRALVLFLEAQGLRVDHAGIEAGLSAIGRGAEAPLPDRRQLVSAGDRIRVAAEPREGALPLVRLVSERPGRGDFAPWPSDAAEPFEVRTRRRGDRVLLPDGHTRKLQDLLIDLRIPREQRDRLPLVVDARGRVVWIVGHWATGAGEPGRWLIAEAKQAAP